MNKVKVLGIIVLVLVLLNICLLAFVFFGKKGHPPHPPESIKKVIVERLKFDTVQSAAYYKLVEQHKSSIKGLEAERLTLKKALYTSIGTEEAAAQDSLSAALGAVQQGIEQVHFKHFSDIELLCEGEQKVLFDQLQTDLTKLFHMERRGPR